MATPSLDVVVVGNVGIDTNIYLYGEEIDFSVEANFTQNFDYVGQAGGYASRDYTALGYATAFIGHIGEDFEGEFIRRELKDDGINLDGIFIDLAGTSRSVNIMYRTGRRKNFYDGKGHMTLEPPMRFASSYLKGLSLLILIFQTGHANCCRWRKKTA